MQKCGGFTFVTKIDISVGSYTFQLDEISQKNGVISTPFGLYQYHRLHMGLTNSPDVIQSTMYPLFKTYHRLMSSLMTLVFLLIHLLRIIFLSFIRCSSGWTSMFSLPTPWSVLGPIHKLLVWGSFSPHLAWSLFPRKLCMLCALHQLSVYVLS